MTDPKTKKPKVLSGSEPSQEQSRPGRASQNEAAIRRRQVNAVDPEYVVNRFLSFVDREVEAPCWKWIGAFLSGYGSFWMEGKMVSAHRASHLLFKGDIAAGMLMLHSCDNKWCVNPAHVRSGTHSENMKEAHARGLLSPNIQYRMLTDEQVTAMRAEYQNRYGELPRLARKYGLSKSAVHAIVTSVNYAHLAPCLPSQLKRQDDAKSVSRERVGAAHHRAKLVDAQVLEIRALWAKEHSVKNLKFICEYFEISRGTAADIVYGVTWKHLLPIGEPKKDE